MIDMTRLDPNEEIPECLSIEKRLMTDHPEPIAAGEGDIRPLSIRRFGWDDRSAHGGLTGGGTTPIVVPEPAAEVRPRAFVHVISSDGQD